MKHLGDGHDLMQPSIYTIDLSLPPAKRYHELALAFKPQVKSLPILFDDLIRQAGLPPRLTHMIARLCLRRVYSQEETEELRGISEVTEIEMYLLVAFNVLLDLFMGCTSGGVKVQDADSEPTMLHFRTLDWGMDPLRKVVVQLDYIEEPGGPVIASNITYAGYVGVLTGVKKDLSMSLNFRPCHDDRSKLANFRFYFNHLLVLLGFRRSISSLLRQYLLPSLSTGSRCNAVDSSLASIEDHLPSTITTAAYITFCDGAKTIVIEKDRAIAEVLQSADFIVVTNHDAAEECSARKIPTAANEKLTTMHLTGMDILVEESIERKDVLCDLYKKASSRRNRATSARASLRPKCITEKDVVKWMNTYPITNEETHFATIMDPKSGKIVWTQRHMESPCPE
ncbi:MAG: hypothetical protein Q9164_003516 [Protoblastenia rupestris]